MCLQQVGSLDNSGPYKKGKVVDFVGLWKGLAPLIVDLFAVLVGTDTLRNGVSRCQSPFLTPPTQGQTATSMVYLWRVE